MQDSTNGGPRKYMEVVYSLRLDGSTAQGTSFACGLAICSQGQHQTQKFLTRYEAPITLPPITARRKLGILVPWQKQNGLA